MIKAILLPYLCFVIILSSGCIQLKQDKEDLESNDNLNQGQNSEKNAFSESLDEVSSKDVEDQDKLDIKEPTCENNCISGFIGHGMEVSFEPRDKGFESAKFIDAQDFGERFSEVFVDPYIEAEGKDPSQYHVSILPNVDRSNFSVGFNLYLQANQSSHDRVRLSEGNFFFYNLPPGNYTLRAVKSYTLKISNLESNQGNPSVYHCLSFEHIKEDINMEQGSIAVQLGGLNYFQFYYHKEEKSCDNFDFDKDGSLDIEDEDDDNDGVNDENDCAPYDQTRFKSVPLYLDSDNDGIGESVDKENLCTGVETPAGYSDISGDCAPDDPQKYQLLIFKFVDADQDGYFAAEEGEICSGKNLPPNYNFSLENNQELDNFTNDSSEWKDTDDDKIGDNSDEDIDGDGVLNDIDDFKYDASEWLDNDMDGVGNNADLDDDNDGILDSYETNTGIYINSKNTGTDPLQADSDNDGLRDNVENNKGYFIDNLHTGTNPNLADSDLNGIMDGLEGFMTIPFVPQETKIIVMGDENEDGFVSPGETIYFTFSSKNISNLDLQNISAVVTSPQNNIVFSENLPIYFGDVNSGIEACGTKSNSSWAKGYCNESASYYPQLTISDVTTAPGKIPINIEFFQGSESIATVIKELDINYADVDLQIKAVSWQESSYSYKDGKLNPGESAYLAIDIINKGSSDVLSLYGTISSLTPGVTFNKSDINIGNLDEGQNKCFTTSYYSNLCEHVSSYNLPKITLPANLQSNEISIIIEFKDKFHRSYTLSLNLPINRLPQVFVPSYEVIADSNGNGKVNSGEDIYIKFKLKQDNIFGAQIDKGFLISQLPEVQFDTTDIFFDSIMSVNNYFCGTNNTYNGDRCDSSYDRYMRISISPSTGIGTYPIKLYLYDENSEAEWIINYNLKVE